MESDGCELLFRDTKDDQDRRVRAQTIYGCDGAFSRLRHEWLKQRPGHIEYHHFEHSYKELIIRNGFASLSENWLHIWPQRDFMLIALPNHDGSFTATLFYDKFHTLKNKQDVTLFFQHHFPEVLDLIGEDDLIRQFNANPVGSLVTVQVLPVASDNVILLGDAAHVILPFYGQGMNAGFEDLSILTEIRSSHPDIKSAFLEYNKIRPASCRAIHALALENYREMRADVLRSRFRLSCSIGRWLNSLFPCILQPRYTMIAFSTVAYCEIRHREKLNVCIVLLFSVYIVALMVILSEVS